MEATKNEQENIREQIDVPEEFNKIPLPGLSEVNYTINKQALSDSNYSLPGKQKNIF